MRIVFLVQELGLNLKYYFCRPGTSTSTLFRYYFIVYLVLSR